MRPEEFGPFLAEQRKQKNMTQTEFAEKLHVSTAAVSKWERGLCLPELAKLEDLADALGISVLEVMKCRVAEPLTAEESVKQTYAETVSLSETQHRKRVLRWTAVISILTLLTVGCVGLHYFPVYRIAQVWYPSYFETGEISQLAYIGSKSDRELAGAVLREAEKAFADVSVPAVKKEETYGLLARYATEAERGGTSEAHSLELWSAHFDGSYGNMWVFYSQEIYDPEGNVVRGSWRIPSLWYLEKDAAGEWQVVGIKEHP